jgi:1,3-beta-glucanosyltransferase GAS5
LSVLFVCCYAREINARWYSCRSDANDPLENAEFMGWNTYLHCDGELAEGEPLVGYEMLLSEFDQYDTQIPVMVRLLHALRTGCSKDAG